jgi:hypothetical protein
MVIARRLHPDHFFGGTMKPCQLLSVGPAAPFPTRPRPVSFSLARVALSLLAFCLSLLFLSPAFAADGGLDPSFKPLVGPLDGVEAIPEIRGQAFYNTGGKVNGRSLIFGQFFGMTVDIPYYQGEYFLQLLPEKGATYNWFLNSDTWHQRMADSC